MKRKVEVRESFKAVRLGDQVEIREHQEAVITDVTGRRSWAAEAEYRALNPGRPIALMTAEQAGRLLVSLSLAVSQIVADRAHDVDSDR